MKRLCWVYTQYIRLEFIENVGYCGRSRKVHKHNQALACRDQLSQGRPLTYRQITRGREGIGLDPTALEYGIKSRA